MYTTCLHVARDIRGKLTCRSARIHKKQVCLVCGWVREYSPPTGGKGEWTYGEWMPPPSSGKAARTLDDQ